MSHALRLENVSVKVDGKTIVKNVNMDIKTGEIAILMGPNGSGKSTLLYGIMGIRDYNTTGRILLNGRDISRLAPWERARLGLALAYQNPPKISIRLGYLAKKISERYSSKDSYSELLHALKLEKMLSRRTYHGFSGGEIKRTELFFVLLQKPRVALLDEPDSGVDIESIRIIAEYINKLAEQGTGVLLVTHHGYILRYIDNLGRGYVMYNGNIVYTSDAYDVVKKVSLYGYTGIVRGGDGL